jgi:hypothetical protein
MQTINDLHHRSFEIITRIDELVDGMRRGNCFVVSLETAAEIIGLLVEAKSVSNRINYHSILNSTTCHGPH